jgi:hypothetical protein
MNTLQKSDTAVSILALAAIQALQEQGRTTSITSYGETPVVPFEDGRFFLETLNLDQKYTLNKEVQKRLQILDNCEIPYTEIVIAHELPKPKKAKKPFPTQNVLHVAEIICGSAAAALGVVVAVSAVGVIGVAIIGCAALLAFGKVCSVDPIVYVRLASGEWLELARWYE